MTGFFLALAGVLALPSVLHGIEDFGTWLLSTEPRLFGGAL